MVKSISLILSMSLMALIGQADETNFIPIECLNKHTEPAFGRGDMEGDVRFDMTEFIAANMHYGMTVLDINTC